jgi:excisionase family DNA binding protein
MNAELPRRALRMAEAARVLSLPYSTLADMVRRGTIRSVRLGRIRLVPVEAIDELLRGVSADRPRQGSRAKVSR